MAAAHRLAAEDAAAETAAQEKEAGDTKSGAHGDDLVAKDGRRGRNRPEVGRRRRGRRRLWWRWRWWRWSWRWWRWWRRGWRRRRRWRWRRHGSTERQVPYHAMHCPPVAEGHAYPVCLDGSDRDRFPRNERHTCALDVMPAPVPGRWELRVHSHRLVKRPAALLCLEAHPEDVGLVPVRGHCGWQLAPVVRKVKPHVRAYRVSDRLILSMRCNTGMRSIQLNLVQRVLAELSWLTTAPPTARRERKVWLLWVRHAEFLTWRRRRGWRRGRRGGWRRGRRGR